MGFWVDHDSIDTLSTAEKLSHTIFTLYPSYDVSGGETTEMTVSNRLLE